MYEKLKRVISESINSNYRKNIFRKNESELPLGSITYDFIRKNITELKKTEDLSNMVNNLSEYTQKEILDLIIKTNQYVLITDNLEKQILKITKKLYSHLFKNEKNDKIKMIFNEYQNSIIQLLEEIDELKIMDTGKEEIDIIPCSEYNAEHQLSILNIDINNLKQPILDIGCGESGYLVQYLRENNLEAYGIDRKIDEKKYYLQALSWFDKNFEKDKWGTIISHLSFTNHFKREHLKKGEGHILYAKKYIEILDSLKLGGSFYYTPDLEFIEQFIDDNKYSIEKSNIKQSEKIKSIKITKSN